MAWHGMLQGEKGKSKGHIDFPFRVMIGRIMSLLYNSKLGEEAYS